MSQKPSKGQGFCRVCFLSFKTHSSNGAIHRHGLRSTPCTGSGQPPTVDRLITVKPLITAQLQPDTTSSNSQCTSSIDSRIHLKHPLLQSNLLRHIPKGARSCAGLLSADVISRLISDPSLLDNWKCLLSNHSRSAQAWWKTSQFNFYH